MLSDVTASFGIVQIDFSKMKPQYICSYWTCMPQDQVCNSLVLFIKRILLYATMIALL